MKKRLLSFAMALCMALTLLPAEVLAEESTEAPVCTCEEACTAETRNEECPVCGAEGAAVEDCCRYTAAVPETQAETAGTEETGVEAARTETDGESEATQRETEGTPETTQTETEGTPETTQTEIEGSPETTQTETEGSPETTQTETEGSPETTQTETEGTPETTQTETEATPETTQTETDGTEIPVCNCESSCTAEAMDETCPVCGVDGAVLENCAAYVAPAAGDPELTAAEKVQAMIDALPTVEELEDADDETVDAVYAAIQDVYDALDELSTEELDQITGLDKLAALLEWFTGPVSTYEEAYSYLIFDKDTGTITGLNDTSMEEVIIPASIDGVAVTSIGYRAFYSCTSLTSITILNGVTSIGEFVFEGCTSLKSISIPGSVTSIGRGAFYNCTSLTSITIPGSVTSIGEFVFEGCTSLTSISIPDGVTSIGSATFYNCTSLTSISIPGSVTSIGKHAFEGCTSLKSITIPNDVTSIGQDAFYYCTNLTSINMPDNLETIDEKVFGECTSLTSIRIPDGVSSIGFLAFGGCENLTSIIIPSSLRYISSSAFSAFSGVGKLENVYYIGTEQQWNSIEVREDNDALTGKVRYVAYMASGVAFTPPSKLTYDGNAKEATVTSNDSDLGKITVKYYNQNGTEISTAPTDAGNYTVKIDIAESNKYSAVSDYEVGRFTIRQAENSFTTDLSIEDWTYGDIPKAPTAEAQFGTPTYSYSTEEYGVYTTTQPTNAGTYWVKAAVEETKNYTGLEDKIQFTILPKTYTVTYAAGSNGSGTVAPGSKTQDVAFTLSSEKFTRAGYEQTGWATSDGGEKAYDLGGTYTDNNDITLYPVWSDITKPTGEISIGTNSWTTLPDNITFGLFFRDTQTVTITASDNSGDAVTIGYLLSDEALTAGELTASTFTTYNGGFTIAPDRACVVYAKLTDTSGNVAYISSDGIVLDATLPSISGIENGKTYCSAQTFTVTETYLDKVTVNGEKVTLDGSSQYTLGPAEGTQTIAATDKAGNKAEMTVTVNDGHSYEWQSENGKYWKKCQVCGDETAKKDIPAITISGADKVCVTQEYRFSFTLPDGTTNGVFGYDFETKGEMGLDPVSENGKLYGVVPAEWYEPNKNSFEVYAGATTEDGFEFFVSKTVALQSEHTDADPKDHICDVCGAVLSQHSGGEATCTSRAICDYCGEEYGEPDTTNHDFEHVPAKAATVTETGNIEYWQCKECGDIFSDEDGKDKIELEDTVIAKLPPKIIEGTGQSVTAGEKKALSFRSNAAFGDFIRVELDGKTLDEKNYTAEEGSTVVTLDADYVSTLPAGEHTIGIVSESGTASTTFTVNAKAGSTNSPQTGDNSPIALWIAILFASGCLMMVAAVCRKKKKYNR